MLSIGRVHSENLADYRIFGKLKKSPVKIELLLIKSSTSCCYVKCVYTKQAWKISSLIQWRKKNCYKPINILHTDPLFYFTNFLQCPWRFLKSIHLFYKWQTIGEELFHFSDQYNSNKWSWISQGKNKNLFVETTVYSRSGVTIVKNKFLLRFLFKWGNKLSEQTLKNKQKE